MSTKVNWDERPPRILAVFRDGLGHVLDYQGSLIEHEIETIFEWLEAPPTDGIWVCDDCRLVRGYDLDGTWRVATAEEWHSFVNGEYVWELPVEQASTGSDPADNKGEV